MSSQPFALPSLLLALVAVPLALGLIPRNRWYGFRTAATLADDRVWRRVNTFAGRALLVACAAYFAVAPLCPMPGPHLADFSRWLLHLAAFALPLAAALVLSLRRVRQPTGRN